MLIDEARQIEKIVEILRRKDEVIVTIPVGGTGSHRIGHRASLYDQIEKIERSEFLGESRLRPVVEGCQLLVAEVLVEFGGVERFGVVGAADPFELVGVFRVPWVSQDLE